MKKCLMMLILVTNCTVSAISQVRYYNWAANPINSYAPKPTSGGGLLYVDNSLFYTTYHDSRTYVCKLESSASFEEIDCQPLITSKFAFGENKLLFVDFDHQLCMLFKQDGRWITRVVPTSVSARGDGLLFKKFYADRYDIYYTSSDGFIAVTQFDNGQWSSYVLYRDAVKPKIGSCFTYGDSKLFYVDEESRLVMLYFDQKWYNWVVNTTAPKVRGDGLIFGENSEIFYAQQSQDPQEDGKIISIYYSPSNNPPMWTYAEVYYAEPSQQGTNFSFGDHSLFYISKTMKTFVLYYDNAHCAWINECLNENHKNFDSHEITFGNNSIFSVEKDSQNVIKIYPTINSSYSYTYLKGKDFMQKNNLFVPKILNYATAMVRQTDGTYVLGPSPNTFKYDTSFSWFCNPAEINNVLDQEFEQIKGLGFNVIRILPMAIPIDSQLIIMSYPCILDPLEYIYIQNKSIRDKVINAFQKFLMEAGEHDLQVLLTTGGLNTEMYFYPLYEEYLAAIADGLKNDPALFAYDYYNEPHNSFNWNLFNLTPENVLNNPFPKSQICNLSENCYAAIRETDKNHLITIGTSGYGDLEFWDPGMVSSDFASIHDYPDQIGSISTIGMSDVKRSFEKNTSWIGINLNFKKPWLIGETSLAAISDTNCPILPMCPKGGYITLFSSDSTYEMAQMKFADNSIVNTFGCGASGYSWWIYRDVRIDNPSDGYCPSAYDGIYDICRHEKLIASFFRDPNTWTDFTRCDCPRPPDEYYYNLLWPPEPWCNIVKGKIQDINQKPVNDALVIGFDLNPNIDIVTDKLNYLNMTFTRSDGTFELRTGTNKIEFLETTAMGKERYWYRVNDTPPQILIITDPITLYDVNCEPKTMDPISSTIRNENKTINHNDKSKKKNNLDISIFPNPNTGTIYLRFPDNNKAEYILIYNSLGIPIKKLEDSQLGNDGISRQINLNEFPDGIYILEMLINGEPIRTKIIKNGDSHE